MFSLSLAEIVEIVSGKACCAGSEPLERIVSGYAFDSRAVEPGYLFFALRGEARDGHEFVGDACKRGAIGAVVSRRLIGLPEDFVQILVESPLIALQKLAIHVRTNKPVKCVVVTGSNGKTTTKEMIAHVLSSRLSVCKSQGNFNNHIGVPISILSIKPDDQVIVLEMASNHPGEIANLASIAMPDVAVITNVGRAHLGFFGSLENIAREKTDLVRALGVDGVAVVNGDDHNIMRQLEDFDRKMIRFGISDRCDLRAEAIAFDESGNATFSVEGTTFKLSLPGLHSVYNSLAAIAVGRLLGFDLDQLAERLARFEAVRMKRLVAGEIEVIDDTYNSNPDSVKVALNSLAALKAKRRVFVMGEMLELGEFAEGLHREVGNLVASLGIDFLVGIGGLTEVTCQSAIAAGMRPESVRFLHDKEMARAELKSILRKGDKVLVKGSRLTRLDEIIDELKMIGESARSQA